MPLYDWECEAGHVSEIYVEHGVETVKCLDCGKAASKVFLRAPMAFVQPDIHYDSPIDGRPITSMSARLDDLARSGCIEYDPEMKTDQRRRIEREDAALEAAVGETVEAEMAKMPSAKRERLQAEMEAGLDAVPERVTPNVKPMKVEVANG